MSALDKALIKASQKEASSASATSPARPTQTARRAPASPGTTPSASPPLAAGVKNPPYRFHDAHAEPPSPHRTLNDQPLNDQAPMAPPPAADCPSEAPSELPSLLALADLPVDQEFAQAFAPDWEVDRLAWPAICERLLESEARYFGSVGQRLKEATRDSHHVMLISGTRRGEGRTTLALCLARCAAEAGIAVAVVDADLENPQLGSRLGIEPSCSWLQVVAGKSPLNEAAVLSLADGLTVFPLTGWEDALPRGDPRCCTVLQAIAAHFPLVIVDTGPLAADGQHLFSTADDSPIDTAIVVRDLRHTTEKRTLAAAALLQRGSVPAVGIAENFREPTQANTPKSLRK
jgi:Mrp family chromosome partitioning ATPase